MGEKIAAVDFRGPALGGSLYGQSHLGCGTSTDGGQVDDDRHLSPGGSDRVGTSLAFSLKHVRRQAFFPLGSSNCRLTGQSA